MRIKALKSQNLMSETSLDKSLLALDSLGPHLYHIAYVEVPTLSGGSPWKKTRIHDSPRTFYSWTQGRGVRTTGFSLLENRNHA